MIGEEAHEQQVRKWVSGFCLRVAGAVVSAAKLFGTGQELTGMLVFPVPLFLGGAGLAGLALLLGWEAERVAALHRSPGGFAARGDASRVRSFFHRLRVGVLPRFGVGAEILAVLSLPVRISVALAVLAGSL